MKKLICLLLLLAVSAVVFAGEVIVKSRRFPSGAGAECIFYSGGREIARQKLDGEGNIIEMSGKVPDGIVKEYYPSGKLWSETNYKNGKPDGVGTAYYENGKLMSEINFKDGKPNGIMKSYEEDGQLIGELNFKDGELNIEKDYYGE